MRVSSFALLASGMNTRYFDIYSIIFTGIIAFNTRSSQRYDIHKISFCSSAYSQRLCGTLHESHMLIEFRNKISIKEKDVWHHVETRQSHEYPSIRPIPGRNGSCPLFTVRIHTSFTLQGKQLTPKSTPRWHTNLMRLHIRSPSITVWVNRMLASRHGSAQVVVIIDQSAASDDLLATENNVE